MDLIGLFAPTAGSGDPVVAALAHGHTTFSWEVAEEAGEEQGEERDGGPADIAVGLSAGEGLVRARVLVIAGAVVEERLHAAHTRSILNGSFRRAHAPPATHPAGGQSPGVSAL